MPSLRWALIGASDIAATRMIPAIRAAGDLLEIQVAKLAATTIASPDTELVRLYQGTEIDGVGINPVTT